MPIPFLRLREFALFQSVPTEALYALAAQMEQRDYARREVVCNKDSTLFELGFLLDGRLQGVDFTVDGRSVGLYYVEPGQYFGELPIVDAQPAPEHVVAVVRSTAAFLPARAAHALIAQWPDVAQQLLQRLAQRVRIGARQRSLLALPNPFQRLCALLGTLGTPGAAGIEPAPTHQELAIMINASRETVTRAFQLLQQQSVLRRDGNALLLLQPDWLQQVAEGKREPPKA